MKILFISGALLISLAAWKDYSTEKAKINIPVSYNNSVHGRVE
jgi:hypothetical protein